MLYAALCENEAGVQVWIEYLSGDLLAFWSGPSNGIALAEHEFVAGTWGDTGGLMASAMLGTGWFARTGKVAAAPPDEVNEIWKVSPLGIEWLTTQSVGKTTSV